MTNHTKKVLLHVVENSLKNARLAFQELYVQPEEDIDIIAELMVLNGNLKDSYSQFYKLTAALNKEPRCVAQAECEDCDDSEVPKPNLPRFEVIEDKYSGEYRIFDNKRYATVSHYSMDYYSIEDVQSDCYKLKMKGQRK